MSRLDTNSSSKFSSTTFAYGGEVTTTLGLNSCNNKPNGLLLPSEDQGLWPWRFCVSTTSALDIRANKIVAELIIGIRWRE